MSEAHTSFEVVTRTGLIYLREAEPVSSLRMVKEGVHPLPRAEGSASGATESPCKSEGGAARWRCTRCGRDEIDARANGCERGPCPMEFVG